MTYDSVFISLVQAFFVIIYVYGGQKNLGSYAEYCIDKRMHMKVFYYLYVYNDFLSTALVNLRSIELNYEQELFITGTGKSDHKISQHSGPLEAGYSA
jgi:hypothetical protein